MNPSLPTETSVLYQQQNQHFESLHGPSLCMDVNVGTDKEPQNKTWSSRNLVYMKNYKNIMDYKEVKKK